MPSDGQIKGRRRRRPLFLGHEVAPGLQFENTPDPRLTERNLPVLLNAADLAAHMCLEPGQLRWLCYDREISRVQHYHRFAIPKRNGGLRTISSPKPLLRQAQNWIRLHVLSQMRPHERVATAFRTGRSIVDNARPHTGKAIVVRIDLKDFFPSITYRRVKGLFRSCGYNEGVATMLGLLCTDAPRKELKQDGTTYYVATGPRVLPQGASTSPDLSNFLCRRLDLRTDAFATSLGFTYTRYADDLVFSHDQDRGNVQVLVQGVYDIVRSEGFEPNLEKTMIMRGHGRQLVTGLLVNDVPRVSRRDTRRFRAIAHQCRTLGYEQVSENLGRDARHFLKGYLSFVRMVNEEQAEKLRSLCPQDVFD